MKFFTDRTYERGYRDGARLAVEVLETVIQGLVEEREEELCACSPGGTDGEDDYREYIIEEDGVVKRVSSDNISFVNDNATKGSPTPTINPEDGSKHYGCSCWDLHRGYMEGTVERVLPDFHSKPQTDWYLRG